MGKETSTQMQFSLDGSTPLLDLIPAIIMLTNFCFLVSIHFLIVLVSVCASQLSSLTLHVVLNHFRSKLINDLE